MLFGKKPSGVGWLAVFLGNPGEKYAKTRHNVGFMTAGVLEKQEKLKINRSRFNALTAIAELEGEKVLLLKPLTYMNLSGNAVRPAAAFYKIPPERVIVVCDDVALPLGKLRIRAKGSDGGHNGLKSIAAALGTQDYPRVKIGVGAPESADGEDAMVDWVLGSFSGRDAKTIGEACERAAAAVRALIGEGIDRVMNLFN